MKEIKKILNKQLIPIDDLDLTQSGDEVLVELKSVWKKRYGQTVFEPFDWLSGEEEWVQQRAIPLLTEVFGCHGIDCLKDLEQDLSQMLADVKRLPDTDLTWSELLTQLEIWARKLLILCPLQSIPHAALADMPFAAFAMIDQVDDDVPDNVTAVWPIDLWLKDLPDELQPRFKNFMNRVYKETNDYRNELLSSVADDKQSKYESLWK